MPKFTGPVRGANPALRFVGDANGPTVMPDQMIDVHPEAIGYQDLFSFYQANYADTDSTGDQTVPMRVAHAGSYGYLYAANRSG